MIILLCFTSICFADTESQQQELENQTIDEVVKDVDLSKRRFMTDKQILILKNESQTDSLCNLNRADMFLWPGPTTISNRCVALTLPLKEDEDVFDIEFIKSNRRFRKVLYEISLMPKKNASDLVKMELKTSFEIYKTKAQDSLKKLEALTSQNLNNANSGGVPGKDWQPLHFGFTLVDKSDGSVSFSGLRLKLFTLMLIAANLELYETNPLIVEISEEAVRQKGLFSDESRYWSLDGAILLRNFSLYNRQILGTALLQTIPSPEKAETIRNQIKAEYLEDVLVSYNAAQTKYDFFENRGNVDWSKGRVTVKHISSLSDSKFNTLFEASKSKALQN
jgi:hypothetical protein